MSAKTSRTGRRAALVAGLGIAGALLAQPVASAHVSISADDPVAGEHTMATFRVPNERDDTSTVRVEVTFPEDHPLASVSPQAVPGWTITVNKQPLDAPVESGYGTTVSEAVTSIVWDGGEIPPNQFQAFPVRLGPLPEGEPTLVFKSLQTYSDGEVVRWIDTESPGGGEPEHPAPTLTVEQSSAAASESAVDGPDTAARVLGGAGLTAGLAALAVSVARRKKPQAPVPVVEAERKETARL